MRIILKIGHPTVTEMIKISDRQWAKELVLPPGIYEYRLVVDSGYPIQPLPKTRRTLSVASIQLFEVPLNDYYSRERTLSETRGKTIRQSLAPGGG